MGRIIKLSENVISKVAAGEVIERPASVIKELTENSLDAKAKKIVIEVLDFGLSKIRVIDNGVGMDSEDLKKAFLRYTTSKIKIQEDLYFIKTFGFRGEALYSISAVSDLTIKSRIKSNNSGNQVVIKNGILRKFEKCGMPQGTEVVVENLFSSVPARMKFLKSPKTELKNIVDIVSYLSLSNYNVEFVLIHNKKEILRLPKEKSVYDRALKVLEVSEDHLIKVNFKDNWFSLTGYISKPQVRTTLRTNILTYFNNRFSKHKILPTVVKEAYGSLLDPHSFPYASLFFEMPSELLDVNVHPRKEEIRFFDDKKVLKLLSLAITEALTKENLIFKKDSVLDKSYDLTSKRIKENASLWKVKEIQEEDVIQLNNLYLITKSADSILILDQHAAHEKILFDELGTIFKSKAKKIVNLDKSIVLNFSLSKTLLLEENLQYFKKLGIELESFGKNTFTITSLPEVLKDTNIKEIIEEVLEDLSQYKPEKSLEKYISKILAFIACKSAIKAGEYLTKEERKKLIEKVLSSDMTYTCPHGRPLLVEIASRELEKMFKRR